MTLTPKHGYLLALVLVLAVAAWFGRRAWQRHQQDELEQNRLTADAKRTRTVRIVGNSQPA